jgi:hypothetical protein
VLAAGDDAVHDGVHIGDVGGFEGKLFRKIDPPPVHDHLAATLFTDFREDKIEFLAVHFEDRRAELDLRTFGEREDGLENLVRSTARDALAGTRAVRFGDGGEEQVEVARDIGHGADG